MAGHSKWSKVKHLKGSLDQKRGQLFSELAKEITVAAQNGWRQFCRQSLAAFGDPRGVGAIHAAVQNASVQADFPELIFAPRVEASASLSI
jgi:hypothetical protein